MGLFDSSRRDKTTHRIGYCERSKSIVKKNAYNLSGNRVFPSTRGKKIIVIGLDQAVVNTGTACLFYDQNSVGPVLIPIAGVSKDHLIVNNIVLNSKVGVSAYPHFFEACDEYVEKLKYVALLYELRLSQFGVNFKSEKFNEEYIIFVVIESVQINPLLLNSAPSLYRMQTVTTLHLRKLFGFSSHIYEYNKSEVSKVIKAGKTKESTIVKINDLFGLHLPDSEDKCKTKEEFKRYTHTTDAIALAYTHLTYLFSKDVGPGQLWIPPLPAKN